MAIFLVFIDLHGFAGHYVPQLAALVLEQNKAASTKINLKGMMVRQHGPHSFSCF
jgi:hypothetical protein